jgi:hypothetical protein
MDYNRMARKLREKIAGFSGELSRGLPKVTERFIREMVYGIQASQSVVLTKIARTLEESISMKKLEERLSRQLLRRGLGQKIEDGICTRRERYVTDLGSKRHTEEICEEDAVSGKGA